MKRFEGAMTVVSGAASGLGRDAAIALVREGAARVALMDVDADGLNQTAELVGPAAQVIVCDVAEPDQVASAWRQVEAQGLDVLMTAAGVIGPGAESLMVSLLGIHVVPLVIAAFVLLDLAVFASALRFRPLRAV